MNTEITKNDILALMKAINDLPSANGQLPSKFFYALSKNRAKVAREVKAIEETINETIFKKFSQEIDKVDPKTNEVMKDPKGKVIKETRVPPEKVEQYQKEVKEFLGQTTTVDIHKISFSEIEPDMPKLQGVNDIYLIFEYICNDEDASKAIKNKDNGLDSKPEEAKAEEQPTK
jgi:hypothetical protein